MYVMFNFPNKAHIFHYTKALSNNHALLFSYYHSFTTRHHTFSVRLNF